MAFTVEQSVIIDRPIQDVWDYVVAHNEWRKPVVLGVRKLTDGPHGAGSRYENTLKMPIGTNKVINEITVFEPPTRLSWRQVGTKGPFVTLEGNNILEAQGDRTHFVLRTTYETPGFWRLLAPVMRRRLENDVFPSSLQQLKEALREPSESG